MKDKMLDRLTRNNKVLIREKSQNSSIPFFAYSFNANSNSNTRTHNLHLVSQSPESFKPTAAQNYNITDPSFSTSKSYQQVSRKPPQLSRRANSELNRFFKINQIGSDKIMLNHIYYLSAILLTLCAILLTQTQIVLADSLLQSKLQVLKISPDIINIPSGVETIKIEVHGNNVKPGDPVPAKYFKDLNLDKITWDVSNFDARHTLVLLDLDRRPAGVNPTNKTISIYNQFTSLNIPGNIIKAGQNIAAFDPPADPCGTKHRLLMLAFHQKQNIDISDVAYMSTASGHSPKRENFKINDFMNKHRLELVAANVILASGDSNAVCSGSISSHGNISSILFAMVMALAAVGVKSRHLAAY